MSVLTARIDVTSTPVPVTVSATDQAFNANLVVRNRGAASVWLGGASVTTSNGFELGAGETLPFRGFDTAVLPLYAVAASGTNTLHVFRAGA